ncbi:hypothetical protein [Vreelandella venusta]|uniref:hypothetical protein n=1 Tax=Vreelandella venusta TaxID=44935 RepID=UPI003AA89E40
MSNYTQWGKNVIFCGPAQMLDQPIRKESPVLAETLPGTVVHLNADGLFEAGPGSLSYVLDKDHLGHEFVQTPYEADDIATAFWPQSGLVLNVLTAATLEIVEDEPLFITATGTLTNVDPADGTAAYGYAAESLTVGASPELVAVKFV